MTIARRITLGFSLLLIITILVGGTAAWQMNRAAEGAKFLSSAVVAQANVTSNLGEASAKTQLAVRTYGLTGDAVQLELAQKNLAEVQTALEACRALAVAQPTLTALAAGVKSADEDLAHYRAGFEATRANMVELTRIRTELDASAALFVTAISKYVNDQDKKLAEEITQGLPAAQLEERRAKLDKANEIIDAGNAIRIANFKAQAMRDPELIEKAVGNFDLIEARITELLKATRQEANVRQLGEVKQAAASYRAGIDGIIRNSADARRIASDRSKAAGEFDATVNGVLERSIQRTSEVSTASADSLGFSMLLVLCGVVSAVIIGALVSFLIIRRLNRVLRDTSGSLTSGAIQIASASGQVSSTSQSLAEGASEQAASLEEISSSLEELASTTKHNAENAGSAKTAADAARAAAEHGSGEMEKMQQAMTAIRQSSTDISKIIKTIDEIAFQTNILALNAAVEAARAGEAGAGFAVVADEVRNLAQRCAVAARETTEKISDAAARSEAGANLTTSVSGSLQEIVTKSREVDRLVAEVANASREQSSGIEQVNIAVGQMDQVTQSNAASAEEAAAAAEELNAQSAEMRHAATELAALVGLNTEEDAGAMHRAPSAKSPTAAHPAPKPAKSVKLTKREPVAPAEHADMHFR
jgi:chlorite dismutase